MLLILAYHLAFFDDHVVFCCIFPKKLYTRALGKRFFYNINLWPMEVIMGGSLLDAYFDDTTMSYHLKEGALPLRKKGSPKGREAVMGTTISTRQELESLIQGIMNEIVHRTDAFLEIDKKLSKVVQLGPYRIVMVYPPLSDGLEITIVKPVKKLSFEEYALDPKVVKLLREDAKGILISGAPGSGKSTFGQALLEEYIAEHKVIKTIESPRDLQVPDSVVQYSFSYGSHSEIRDILLLSRPDFTMYDEVRNTDDFQLYKDLRLTGIGLIGVIHATKPIDGIQRFLGTIDMGIIPQVIDTVVYISKGEIGAIFTLELQVKVPAGMMSDDLARPVIVIKDFMTDAAVYEIYSFGEQVVVVPLDKIKNAQGQQKTGMHTLVKESLYAHLAERFAFDFLIELPSQNSLSLYVPVDQKAVVIGKAGKNIQSLEAELGVSIQVKTFEELPLLQDVTMKPDDRGRVILRFPDAFQNKEVTVMVGDNLFTDMVSPSGEIMLKNKTIVKQLYAHGVFRVDTTKLH